MNTSSLTKSFYQIFSLSGEDLQHTVKENRTRYTVDNPGFKTFTEDSERKFFDFNLTSVKASAQMTDSTESAISSVTRRQPHSFKKVNASIEGKFNVNEENWSVKQIEMKGEKSIEGENTVKRSNSVSEVAKHFKALEEKAKAISNETSYRRTQKSNRRLHNFKERKDQCSDRFVTQPVTYEEVREAVLQNKQKEESEEKKSTDDEFDPSKLSLAERVRLFNQKLVDNPLRVSSQKFQRRGGSRYKTQPVTSEEVEVASRLSVLNAKTLQNSLETGMIIFYKIVLIRKVQIV